MKFRLTFCAGLFLMLLGGCKQSCKDINCLHGGSCSKGTCDCNFQYGGQFCDSLCPSGYTGEFCNVETRQQFIRTWSATITSSAGGTLQQQLSITAGSNIGAVNIINFDNQGFNFVGVIATGNSFSFSEAATGSYTGMVSGSGVVNGNNLLINLVKQDGTSYVANCNP